METGVDRFLRILAIAASVVAVAALVSVVFNIWLGARRIGEPAIFFAVFSWLALGVRRMRHPPPGGEDQAAKENDPPSDQQRNG
jgi:hypothetical protein